MRLRTLIGAAEMLKLGITSLMDDAFFVPLTTRSSIDAIAGAYEEIGIRATLALDQPIVVEYEKYPFLRDILPEDVRRTMERAPRETARRNARALCLSDRAVARRRRMAASPPPFRARRRSAPPRTICTRCTRLSREA